MHKKEYVGKGELNRVLEPKLSTQMLSTSSIIIHLNPLFGFFFLFPLLWNCSDNTALSKPSVSPYITFAI